jgi:DGQHR domain-containing protein
MEVKKYNSLKTHFNSLPVYTQQMKVRDVLTIHYVAIRGKDREEGAVQRVLSKVRIKDIRDYILSGKEFFSTFILNWTNDSEKPKINIDGTIELPIIPNSAQVLDGQHRLAGLSEAYKIDENLGDKELLVSLCLNLTNKQAAEIFLNINSEQKPVNRSLIYDLFGMIDDEKDYHINRASDIAKELNENKDSAYYAMIKTPGLKRGDGYVDLSAIVNALKSYLKKGEFEKHRLSGVDFQKTIFINFFNAIKFFYDKQNENIWLNKNKNPFARNAGATAAIEYLMDKLIEKCKERKSFTIETFKDLLNLEPVLYFDEIKGLSGPEAQSKIKEFLEANLLSLSPDRDEYEV